MEARRGDWRTVALLIASLSAALITFSFAAFALTYAIWGFINPNSSQSGPSTLQAIVLASGITLTGALFLPAAYFSIQRLRGREVIDSSPKPLRIWQAVLLVLFWVSVSVLAQLFLGQNIPKWFTPPLYLLAIGTPVYGIIRLATGGLNAGSHQRQWGVFATSMAVGPTLAILAEGTLAVLVLIGAGIYFSLHPELLTALKQYIKSADRWIRYGAGLENSSAVAQQSDSRSL